MGENRQGRGADERAAEWLKEPVRKGDTPSSDAAPTIRPESTSKKQPGTTAGNSESEKSQRVER
jgi:hypothetical protein